jgi:hypothetical protein
MLIKHLIKGLFLFTLSFNLQACEYGTEEERKMSYNDLIVDNSVTTEEIKLLCQHINKEMLETSINNLVKQYGELPILVKFSDSLKNQKIKLKAIWSDNKKLYTILVSTNIDWHIKINKNYELIELTPIEADTGIE